MQNISLIKQKILQYIDFIGVSKYKFYKKTGITRGVLDKEGGISEDNIAKFIAYYPEINPEWLLTGKGEMLKQEGGYNVPHPTIYVAKEPPPSGYGSSQDKADDLATILALKDSALKDKDAIIEGLRFKISILEKELAQNKSKPTPAPKPTVKVQRELVTH